MDNTENNALAKQNQFFKQFYLEDGQTPIPFDQLHKRVKRRFSEIEKSSSLAMLDLFFMHENFNSFYDRKDSFSKYLKDELKISKSQGYGILNSVTMLCDYYRAKSGGKKAIGLEGFLVDLSSAIDQVGIKKLIIMAGMKDQKKKFSLIDTLLEGHEITAEELLKEKTVKTANLTPNLSVEDNKICWNNTNLITFTDIADDDLRTYVYKAVSRYLSKG
jgi:hypothetical protein